jgi:hypothetical protein
VDVDAGFLSAALLSGAAEEGYRAVAGLAVATELLSGNRARPQFQDWHQARLIPCVE